MSEESIFRRIAQKVVHSMRIKEDEMIIITCGSHNLFLAELIAIECWKVGAVPHISVASDNYMSEVYSKVPVNYLEKTPRHLLAAYDEIDVKINLENLKDPRILSNIPENKVAAKTIGGKPILDKMLAKGVRWSYIGYPSPGLAKLCGIGYRDFKDLFFSGLDIDYSRLSEVCYRIAGALGNRKIIHITTEKGTDLKFEITGRKIFIDDGMIDEEDIARGDLGLNFPSGEVYTTPIETTANGVAIFDAPIFWNGKPINNLYLRFENGKIVEFDADKGCEVFSSVLNQSKGDKDRIAEFGIGANYMIKPIGYTLMDEKASKTIHIAIGRNIGYGGKNDSNIHWDLVLINPTIELDDKHLMEDGKLNV